MNPLDARMKNENYRIICLSACECSNAPKGVQDDDAKAIYRGPDQLRTIFGGNTDNKVLSGTIGNMFAPATLALTPDVQRGFCRGRQLALNIEDETYFNLKASSNFRICMHINTLYSFFESQLSLDYCVFMLLAIFRAQNFLHRVCFNRNACQNGEAAEANLQESH